MKKYEHVLVRSWFELKGMKLKIRIKNEKSDIGF